MTGKASERWIPRESPPRRGRSGESGFTLVELVVTVAILGVLAAMALPTLPTVMPKIRLGTATQKLANEIAMGRMTAIARSVDGELVLNPTADTYFFNKVVGGTQYAASGLGAGIHFDHDTGSDTAIVKFVKDDTVATDVTTLRIYANGTVDLYKVPGGLPANRVAWDLANDKTSVYVALQARDRVIKRRVVVTMMGRIYTERWTGGTTWVGD